MAFAGSSYLRLVPLLLAVAHLYLPLSTDGQQGIFKLANLGIYCVFYTMHC